MSKISKFRKPTVAILTALLIVSIAMPLLSLATAATASFSLETTTGPNGTSVKVTGTGFTPSLNQFTSGGAAFTVTIDGSTVKAVTHTAGTVTFSATSCLRTDANGVLSGYFVIKDLSVGTHTNIIISDGSHSVQSNNGFVVTRPTVALSTPSGAVGTSQLVTGAGFPTGATGGPTVTNVVTAGSYPTGTALAGLGTGNTASATTLSTNSISTSAGTFKATVTPQGYITSTSENVFSITDSFGNVASTAFAPTAATATLSATSGPVGTTVVATITGFGPGATVQTYSSPNPSGVWIGNSVTPSSLTITSVTVNQQGQVQVPITITGTGADFIAGAKTIKIVDTFGNIATATFTITPEVTIEMGDGTISSGTTVVPSTAATTGVYLQVSGFAPNAKLTFTRSPGVPVEWTTFASAAAITTNAGGVLTLPVWSSTVAAPSAGTYSITVSDGTNTASATLITVSSLPYMVLTPTSGPAGSYISVKTFDLASTAATAMTFDGGAGITVGTYPTSTVWPATGGVKGLITLPAATTGEHTIAVSAGGASGASASFTVTNAATVTAFPTSVVIGQSVPLSGTGYKTSAAGLTPTITIDSVTVSVGTLAISASGVLSGAFTMPTFLPGDHTIRISDGTTAATTTITVLPASISIAPSSGPLTTVMGTATKLELSGSGFVAGESIRMTMEDYPGNTVTLTAGTPVGLTVVNPSGNILLYNGFALPAGVIAGPHTITVTGLTSGAAATFTYTVTPKVTTSTSAIRAGQNLGISATGFAGSSGLTLTLNGTLSTWYDLSATPATAMTTPVTTTSAGSLALGSNRGTVIASTLPAGTFTVTLTDSLGNTASTTITILADPEIVLSATNLVAGAQGGVATTASTYINGTGFTPGAGRTISVKIMDGSTTVATLVGGASLLSGTVTVGSAGSNTGKFNFAAGTTNPVVSFVVPSSVPAGTYTLQVTIGTTLAPPVETAIATITVMSAPVVTAPTTAAALQNVTITVTGLTTISTVSIGSATLVAAGVPATCTVVTPNIPYFGPVTIPTTGANANTLTTWLLVPETLMAGSYTLTVTDTPAGISATTPITVTPGLVISSGIAVKGDSGSIAGYGFAPNSIVTAKINGAALPEAASATITTDGSGKFTGAGVYTFNVPASAIVNNTITVTDASGNAATTYLSVTVPTLIVNPASAAAGSTVQLIGSGYKVNSDIFVQVGGLVVATTPISVTATGGSFVCYITIPATTAQGATIITATDTSNNQGSADFTVTNGQTSTGITVNTSTMSSTAQTTNGAGQATTTFTQGSTVKASFSLVSSNGASGTVVCAVTFQQGAKVYNMASAPAAISPTATLVSFSNLLPAGATGTWTATLQVYAADGTTPLGVTTLTFTVS